MVGYDVFISLYPPMAELLMGFDCLLFTFIVLMVILINKYIYLFICVCCYHIMKHSRGPIEGNPFPFVTKIVLDWTSEQLIGTRRGEFSEPSEVFNPYRLPKPQQHESLHETVCVCERYSVCTFLCVNVRFCVFMSVSGCF